VNLDRTFLVTGGAGFIGAALIRQLIGEGEGRIVNVDCLTYAGNLESLDSVAGFPNYIHEKVDIRDAAAVWQLFERYRPDGIFHLAAESHVDRSIDNAADFISTNILGTYVLLEAAREYMEKSGQDGFRFLHVSTDEVFGSLGMEGRFNEETRYQPRSPYSASKASSDHLARAWFETYGVPVIVTNCSNNYGPFQFPEKLIPLSIIRALSCETLPVYGDGKNIRDWIFVEDHVSALILIMKNGRVGETYAVGGNSERTNIAVVTQVCKLLDEMRPRADRGLYADSIQFVKDRPGHDFRYAIDSGKLSLELGWGPRESFDTGIRKTVAWYLENDAWVKNVLDGSYRGQRLGTLK